MNLGLENKKQTMIAGIVGVLALGFVGYRMYDLFGGSSTPPPVVVPVITSAPIAPPVIRNVSQGTDKASTPPGFVVGSSAKKIATTSGQLDPTLHEDAMHITESLVYTGNGRNIFGVGPAVSEVVIPKPTAPVRTQIAAVAPAPYVDPGPPPPPPIDLKFFGTATAANGNRRAFLLHGEDVFLASAGDIVQRRYKVVTIAATSIVIEDMPNNNKQTLPIQGN
jgi:hypothetical protein